MEEKISTGFGNVQLGEVTADASWKVIEDQVEIAFETRSLSLDKQKILERYRISSLPVPFKLPGNRKIKSGVVLGFECNDRTAKFYVSSACSSSLRS